MCQLHSIVKFMNGKPLIVHRNKKRLTQNEQPSQFFAIIATCDYAAMLLTYVTKPHVSAATISMLPHWRESTYMCCTCVYYVIVYSNS